jgi:PPP family 3-phenylpropionic acid transporter
MSMVYYGFYLYRTNYATDVLKFSTAQFGYMSGMMAAVGFLFMALWGYLADLTGNPKLVLSIVSVGTAGSFSLFLLGPKGVALNMFLVSLYAAFASGFMAMCDDQVLRILSFTNEKALYGRQRLWETLSFSVTTRLLGYLIKAHGTVVIHIWVPATAALFILAVLFFGTNKPEILVDKSEESGVKSAVTSPQAVKQATVVVDVSSTTNLLLEEKPKRPLIILLANPNYLFLLFGVFLTGCARSVMSIFLTRYLQNDMKLDEEQAATAAISGIVLELLIFFGSSYYLRHLGIYWMLIIAQVAMVIRGWAYFVMDPVPSNWWLVYLIELLKGVGFGFTQTAGVRLANEVVPPGLEATAQSMYTGMYSQLPTVLVACLGGEIYQNWGAQTLFLGTAILSTCSLLLFLAKYSYDGRIYFRAR